MTCQAVQELILEDLDGRLNEEQRIKLRSHLTQCSMCQSFWEVQRDLDAALVANCVAPEVSSTFRPKLAQKIRSEKKQALEEWLPDILHLGSGIVATTACVLWLSVAPALVLTVGIALTFVSYALQTMFRFWLEDLEGL